VALLLVVFAGGCGGTDSESADPATEQAASGAPLQVLIVDASEAETEIRRYWNAEADVPVETRGMSRGEFAADPLAAIEPFDVVVYPSEYAASLAAEGGLLTIGIGQLADERWNGSDVLDREKGLAVRWGDETIGVSLGHRPWLMVYRADLLEQAGIEVPTTWEEYDAAAKRLATSGVLVGEAPVLGSAEPTASPWSGHLLLARSGASIRHQGAYSGLFDLGSTTPLLETPPFVEALERLAAVAPSEALTPEACLDALASGRAAIGILPLPTIGSSRRVSTSGGSEAGSAETEAADPNRDATDTSADQVIDGLRIAPLPGSNRVYVNRDGSWRERRDEEGKSVPYSGGPGTLASITSETRRAGTSWGFVRWLGSSATQNRLAGVLSDSMPTRRSGLGTIDRWLDPRFGAVAAEEAAELLRQSEGGSVAMLPPRSPLERQLMDHLDRAVAARREGMGGAEALAEAAGKWSEAIAARGAERFSEEFEAGLGL